MGRDPALERPWQKRMGEYEQSGLTAREFCKREGLVLHQFSWWRSELKRRALKSSQTKKPRRQRKASRKKSVRRRKADAGPSFVPVTIQSASPSGASVEIVLDQPPRIRVSAGFDAELLREVVRVLEQR